MPKARALAWWFVVCLVALAVGAAFRLVSAQDTAAARIHIDSARRETCRGGRLSPSGLTCSGATATARVTVLRRHLNNADSALRRSPAPVLTTITVAFDYTTTTHWSSGALGRFARDNESLCASVEIGGVRHLGAPAAVARYVRHDSLQWRTLPDTGAALRARCASHAFATAPFWPVTWETVRLQVQPADTARFGFPVAAAVVR